jgi:hypothetical protein
MTEAERVAKSPEDILSFDDPAFLEPPHHHDLRELLEFICAPPGLIGAIDPNLRDAIQAAIMSTSIMFASLKRLRLCQEDLQSAHELDQGGGNACGELKRPSVRQCCAISPDPICFNSKNRFRAEWLYFRDEVLPDWRHKVRLVNMHMTHVNQSSHESRIDWEAIVRTWWHALQDLVSSWEMEASRLSFSNDDY